MEWLQQNFDMIIGFIGLLSASGLYLAVKKAIKETKEVLSKYESYKMDGFTEEEVKDLIKELGEAINEFMSVYNIIRKLWKKKP